MRTTILLVLIIHCSFSSFGQKSFRTIRFSHTPLHLFRGGVPCKNGSELVALYKFQYESSLLKSVTYQMNGKNKPIYENYTCSDFIWASINEFEHTDESVVIKHYDYLGNPTQKNPAVSVYTKDEDGRVIGLKYLNKEGEPAEFRGIHRYEWKYLEEGIGEIRYSIDGSIARMNNWFPYTWVILTFDKEKNLKTILTTNENWVSSQDAIRIEFETRKNETVAWVAMSNESEDRISLTGPQVAEVRHDYNDNGYLTRTRFYDIDGERTKSKWGHMGFIRKYNEHGNRLSYKFINEKDETALSIDRGYSGQKFIWDKEERFRLQTFYINQEEEKVFREARGYASISYVYNHEDVEIGEIYQDENGEVLNSEKAESFLILIDENGERKKMYIK